MKQRDWKTIVFIYHFHRIIRHRLVWGLFAVIVSLLFLFVGYSNKSSATDTTVAHIGKDRIGQDTYAAFERNIRGYGRNRDNTTPAAVLATQVWQQVAAFQTAATLGIGVSKGEIRSILQESGNFTTSSGAFDVNRYREGLHNAGLTPAIYEEYLSHQMTLRKLGAVVESATWIAPVELDDELASWTDQVTLRYAVASNRFATAPMNLTDVELHAYYDAHPEAFHLPNRAAVQFVALSISNFLAHVTVADDDIRAYYDDHADVLVRTTPSNTTENLTLAEARPAIVDILKREGARHAAATNLATAFLDLAIKGGSNGFAQAAQAFHLPVRQTALFAADDEIPGIENQTEFREIALDLDASQADGRYNIVRGSNVVYALAAWTNSPAHQPTFAEVRDRVRPLALAKARDDAFQAYVGSLHTNLVQSGGTAAGFAAAAHANGMNVSTSITFVAHTLARSSDLAHGMAVLQSALHLRPGEISEPRYIDDGVLFVRMETRQSGDPLSAEMLRQQVRGSLERARGSALQSAWLSWNLNRLGLDVSEKKARELKDSTPRNDD